MRQLRRDFSTIDHRVLMERGLHRSQVLSRHRRRALDKRTKQLLKKRVYPRLRDLIESGAGFPIDQTIRAFALEFNDRALSHGSEVMPASFNVMEAFLFPERVEDRIAVLRLHPERDHMFSLSDFLDFLTSKDGPIDPVKEALRAPEGIIHSYTPSGALEDLTFLYGDSRAFMVAGFSFVRHGSEITWVLLGGFRASDTELTSTYELEPGIPDPRKKYLLEKWRNEGPDLPLILEGTKDVWKTMIFGRLTADTGKHQVRYRAREYQNSFAIHTDDPAVFECVSESDANRTINAALDIFDEEGVLFNLAEGLCALPAYFDFKITLVREVNKEVLPPSTKPTKGTRRHAKPQGKRFCKVAALEILNPAAPPVIRRYKPPQYRVEVEGFWRRLPDGSTGKDFQDEPVQGRTWVKAHLRWRDRPPRVKTIYVKSSVAAAKAKVAALSSGSPTLQPLEVTLPQDSPERDTEKSGYLYVMRCPLMDGDVW